MTEIWAHACAEGAPTHNRLTSFEHAVTEGPDGLELDVHRTFDGRLVCLHDETVVDESGEPWTIGAVTYDELRHFRYPDLGDGDTRIPLLDEVYELLRPTPLRLNIEAKNLLARYPGMAETLVTSIAGSGMAERVVVSSFHHALLAQIRALSPGLRLAALTADGLIDPWMYLARIGLTEVHPHYSSLAEPGILDGYRHAGIAVRAWTVNNPELWTQLSAAGIDAIITDTPVTARATIAG